MKIETIKDKSRETKKKRDRQKIISLWTSVHTGELLNIIGAFLAVLSMILTLVIPEWPLWLSVTMLVLLILWMIAFIIRYVAYFFENPLSTLEELFADLF